MTTPSLTLPMLQRLAEGGARKKSDIMEWFEDQDAAEDAFAFAAERKAIVPIFGTGPEDPLARWGISAELVLRFAAEA